MKSIIKSTKYCDLVKQAKVTVDTSVYTIEKNFVKGKQTTEIRFAYYKKDKSGNEKFVPRPLDLEEEHLINLLVEGVKAQVITKEMLQAVIKKVN